VKRITLIILWLITFLVAGTIISGAVIGILIGFTAFDVEARSVEMVIVIDITLLICAVAALYYGVKEKLPGTQRPTES
jgi:hypothetical protein